jgi:hypothetical protein
VALTHEEITAIKKEVINECKNLFVQIDDCNEKQTEVNRKFANDDKRIDRIMYLQEDTNNKLTKNNWLTITILGIIIASVLTMILKANGVF